jgi:hypothetical protein
MHNFKKIFLIVILLIPLSESVYSNNADFSTPENTVKTYYESYSDTKIRENCFYTDTRWTGGNKKIWKDYKIISIKNTKRSGKLIEKITVSKDALEVIVEVTMDHPQKGNPKTKFWYLLQKKGNEWKILSHSHIADKNYPAYD